MYHYTGVHLSAEKKVVVAETDITDLYDDFKRSNRSRAFFSAVKIIVA